MLLEKYGMVVTVEGERIWALFQPVTGKLERLAAAHPGPLGQESGGRYVYIGPLVPELQVDMKLEALGRSWEVRSVQRINGYNGPAYQWALCVGKGWEEPWSTNS